MELHQMAGTSETKIALGVLRIADAQSSRVASFRRLYDQIPVVMKLTAADCAESETRPGEPMWHQIVRNIQSHHAAEGNYIAEGYLEHIPRVGYRITDAGRRFRRAKGL
jgi:hypothetical protein